MEVIFWVFLKETKAVDGKFAGGLVSTNFRRIITLMILLLAQEVEFQAIS